MKGSKAVSVSSECVRTTDVKPHPGVTRRPGTNRYQFQLQTPTDLRHLIRSQWACRTSLGTADLLEANAKAKTLQAEWQAKFDELRGKPARALRAPLHGHALAPVKLTQELVQQAANLMHGRMLEADESARMAGLTAAEMEAQALALEVERGLLGRAYSSGDSSPVENIMPAWLMALGMEVSAIDPLRPMLARELVKARLKAIQARQQRHKGELVDTPPEPRIDALEAAVGAAADELPPADKPAHLLKLRDVFELWKLKRGKTGGPLSSKTVDRGREVVQAFEEACGNPPVASLTRHHAHQLRDHLLAKGLEPGTAKDRVDWVRSMLNYEVEEHGRLKTNPWPTVKVEGSSEAVTARKATRAAELSALFSLSLFQAYTLPTAANAGRDAAYWVPVLGVYTGARITELAQLLVADVFQKAGLWRIAFRVTYPEWQSLKNKPSKREIPLHPELIRLGFLKYLEAMQAAGHERLFPLVQVSGTNNAGGALSSWFSKLKTSAGWGSEHTFHSFRHGVETMLKRAKEPKPHIDRYTGHGAKDVADRTYTHLEPEDLVETAEKVRPEGLELPMVFPPAGWSAPARGAGVLKAKQRRTTPAD